MWWKTFLSTLSTSVVITIILFLVLNFWINPRNEEKKRKQEQFKNLHAPLYTMVVARITTATLVNSVRKGKEIIWGNAGEKGFINDDYMIKYILKNSGYASSDLLRATHDYVYHVSYNKPKAKALETKRSEKGLDQREANELTELLKGINLSRESLIKSIVKDYNKIKKELKLEVNTYELTTGILEYFKEITKEESQQWALFLFVNHSYKICV